MKRAFLIGEHHVARTSVDHNGMLRQLDIIEVATYGEDRDTPVVQVSVFGKKAIKALKHACIDALRKMAEEGK